jgi:HD-GYP domain-containing protein (c-di-GMP phosphodiesterase class II)
MEGHSERVRLFSVEIGRELRLSEKELAALSLAAKLHDNGKVKI